MLVGFEHAPKSLQTHIFRVPILRSTPHHVRPKYRCLDFVALDSCMSTSRVIVVYFLDSISREEIFKSITPLVYYHPRIVVYAHVASLWRFKTKIQGRKDFRTTIQGQQEEESLQ